MTDKEYIIVSITFNGTCIWLTSHEVLVEFVKRNDEEADLLNPIVLFIDMSFTSEGVLAALLTSFLAANSIYGFLADAEICHSFKYQHVLYVFN